MLKGKIAVVTGGSRGIGQAICLELAAQGADIAFIYAGNDQAAGQTLGQLNALGGRAQNTNAILPIRRRYRKHSLTFLLILVRSIS